MVFGKHLDLQCRIQGGKKGARAPPPPRPKKNVLKSALNSPKIYWKTGACSPGQSLSHRVPPPPPRQEIPGSAPDLESLLATCIAASKNRRFDDDADVTSTGDRLPHHQRQSIISVCHTRIPRACLEIKLEMMGFIAPIQPPQAPVRWQKEDTIAFVEKQDLSKGTLYIAER